MKICIFVEQWNTDSVLSPVKIYVVNSTEMNWGQWVATEPES